MANLYKTLDEGRIGIFESPTGTGKSLSIICSALQWLVDNEDKVDSELVKELPSIARSNCSTNPAFTNSSSCTSSTTSITPDSSASTCSTDWTKELLERQRKEQSKYDLADMKEKRVKLQKRIDQLRKNKSSLDRPNKKRKVQHDIFEIESEDTFLLEDYDSDTELKLKKAQYVDSDDEDNDDSELQLNVRKVYYCSRTHTQLTQFANEVKRTAFFTDIALADKARVVCLASRKNLCVNDNVLKLNSITRINDKCLDMQKSTTAKCPYNNPKTIPNLRDHALMKVRDIEELTSLGARLDACPYYGTRQAIGAAQMVLLPYQTLLHKLTRESLGISLKNNIVILDEAHNLVEAINDMYAVEISASQIAQSLNQLQQYLDRYPSHLPAHRRLALTWLLFVNQSLLKAFKEQRETKNTASSGPQGLNSTIHTINDFVFLTKIDNINMFKLEKYFQRSEIVKKLHGFFEKFPIEVQSTENVTESEESSRHRPALGQIEAFLLALTNADKDGRILVTHNANEMKSTYKYLQLNAEVHFKEVVSEARSVILAGGTLQPIDTLIQNLFTGENERISLHSYGHIVPPSHLLVLPLSAGPCSTQFEFTHALRSGSRMMDELGATLLNFCQIIPDGVVCFFPSYAYGEQVLRHWTENNTLAKLALKKRVFQEPRNSQQVEEMLKSYKKCIDQNFNDPINPTKPRGAIMFCVVGGKMSEGINFSDGLARCVVVVGLPYPNPADPFLKEKMAFISSSNSSPSGDYYDNLCMQAVNQSIGRSIRHAKDYATIVLIDQRYQRPNIINKLPKWLAGSIPSLPNDAKAVFGSAFGHIRKFFADKKDTQAQIEKERSAR